MKWKTLRHNGVAFPPEYDHRGLTVRIKGEPFKPDPLQEEMLMAWAKKKDTPYVNDPIFQRNFLADLKEIGKLPAPFAGIELSDFDWTELHAIADREKTANLSPEEKKKRSEERKATRDELKANFGMATIDDIETEIGAYLVEPPGILMGRGEHPLRGKWKERVQPEEVVLNLDEDAPVPDAPDGHHWGEIVHEHDSMWVASWYDKLAKKRKYVWLADSSHLRQERDKEKYVKAQKLESGLERVRAEIQKGMNFTDPRSRALEKKEQALSREKKALDDRLAEAGKSGDGARRKKIEEDQAAREKDLEDVRKQREKLRAVEMKKRQIATTCYLIDRLAMRVGDEKDEDEADTVGASTLRVEHVKIGGDKIEFDFLGKDSVQWQKFLSREDGGSILATDLEEFIKGKQPGDQIFDKVDSTHVNQFLSSIVPGLTAKVFRTYHATTTVRGFLQKSGNLSPEAPGFEKEYRAKEANLQAAITCNHKRTPPKNWEQNLAKKQEAVEKLRAAEPDLTRIQKELEKREAALKRLVAEQDKFQAEGTRRVEQKEQTLARAHARWQALENPGAGAPPPSVDLDQLRLKVQERESALKKAQEQQAEYQIEGTRRVEKKEQALAQLVAKPEPKSASAAENLKKQRAAAQKDVEQARRNMKRQARALKERVNKAQAALKRARETFQRAQDAPHKAVAEREKNLSRAKKEYRAAEQALKKARQDLQKKKARLPEKIDKARAELERAQTAPERARQEHEDRLRRAERQFELARDTRDYNLGTSLKNYIDPRVYKAWGDHVGFDWKRLYTKALQRKFAWVNQSHVKWSLSGRMDTAEDNAPDQAQAVEQEDYAPAGAPAGDPEGELVVD